MERITRLEQAEQRIARQLRTCPQGRIERVQWCLGMFSAWSEARRALLAAHDETREYGALLDRSPRIPMAHYEISRSRGHQPSEVSAVDLPAPRVDSAMVERLVRDYTTSRNRYVAARDAMFTWWEQFTMEIPQWRARGAHLGECEAISVLRAWVGGRMYEHLPPQNSLFGMCRDLDSSERRAVAQIQRILRTARRRKLLRGKGPAPSMKRGRQLLGYGFRYRVTGRHILVPDPSPKARRIGQLANAAGQNPYERRARVVEYWAPRIGLVGDGRGDRADRALIMAAIHGGVGSRVMARWCASLGVTQWSHPTLLLGTRRQISAGSWAIDALHVVDGAVQATEVLIREGWDSCYHCTPEEMGLSDVAKARLLQTAVDRRSWGVQGDVREVRRTVARICKVFRRAGEVRFSDSRAAGNCAAGTSAWLRRLGLPGDLESIGGGELARVWRAHRWPQVGDVRAVANHLAGTRGIEVN